MKPTDETTEANDIFGISDKRAHEIGRKFNRLKFECETLIEVADGLGITKKGALCFSAYLFGRLVEMNERKAELIGQGRK